jgi:hypothetical protein
MELNISLEAESRSADEVELTKIYYCIHKSPSLYSILSEMNPVHILTHSVFKIHFNIILPSMAMSPKYFVLNWLSN